jgi:hypothetical protein
VIAERVLGSLDEAATAYVRTLARRLEDVLGDDLVGVYLVGSAALGGYVPGRSDVDVAVAAAGPLDRAVKQTLARELSHERIPCPTKGLELVVYPAGSGAFELNLNTGPGIPEHVSFDPVEEPFHWFVLDRAIGDAQAVVVEGPPWGEALPRPSRAEVLAALDAVLEWQEGAEPGAPNSVLNACRAWRLAEEGVLSSKDDAAAWARPRLADPGLVDRALALRRGEEAEPLDEGDVRALLATVRGAVREARA